LGTAERTLKEDKAMDEVTDRKFTRLDKSDLEEFIKAYDLSHSPLVGHSPPNLLFGNKPSTAPDPHYFATAGKEPPSQTKERRLNWLVRNWEFSLMMVVIAVLLVLYAIYSR
jgi:hypothetical protein